MEEINSLEKDILIMEMDDYLYTNDEKRQIYEEKQRKLAYLKNNHTLALSLSKNIHLSQKGNPFFNYEGHRYAATVAPTHKGAKNSYKLVKVFRDGTLINKFKDLSPRERSVFSEACSIYMDTYPQNRIGEL